MTVSNRPMAYTTKIAAAQTVGECQALLAKSGASAVAVEYQDGEPTGLSFRLDTPHGRRDFTLPVNIAGIRQVLVNAERGGQFASMKKSAAAFTSEQHAANVAWRVIRDWLEANLALIAAGMAQIDQVMLPYLHVAPDKTLYAAYRERETALELTAGTDG